MKMSELVDKIVESFKELKLRPVRGTWGRPEQGTACGLTALFVKETGRYPTGRADVAAVLGLEPDFTLGFTEAWDGDLPWSGSPNGKTYWQGRTAALEALRALRAAGYDV